jgi:hypothetical protein
MSTHRPLSGLLAALGGLTALLVFSAPALAAPPEEPVTKPATAITGTTATLNGELNPNAAGEPGAYDFAYKQSATECTGESVAPEPPGSALGHPKEAVSVKLPELQPSRPYTFCVVAKHEAESRSGLPVTFETLAVAPEVYSEGVFAVTPFEATLFAAVNPNNQVTKYSFEYSTKATGETLEGTVTTFKGETPLPEEFGGRSAIVETGPVLASATTYYFRVIATNATGTTEGPVEHFETLTAERPIVASERVSGLTATDATLGAKINPNYQETSYHFEYSTKATGQTLEGTVTQVAGAPPAPLLPAVFEGEGQLAGPVDLGGALTPGTIYFYRVVAENETSKNEGKPVGGPVESFETLGPAVVTTGEAQNLTQTTATLSGTVNPVGAATTYHFAYIEQAGYEAAVVEKAANPYAEGSTTSESGGVGSDYTVHAVGPTFVSELRPGVTYHYGVVATNSLGTTIDRTGATFTASPPTPPAAVTGEAVNVSPIPAQAAVTPVQLVAWPPFVAAALAAAEPRESTSTGGSKPLTKAQKLAKALAACNRKPKKRRPTCRRQARKRYR